MSAALNKLVNRTLVVPQTTTGGVAGGPDSPAVYIGDLTGIAGPQVSVTQSGTNTTGTYQVKASHDGITYTTIGADITGAINRSLAIDYNWVKITCTVNVSGAANVFGASVTGRPAKV